jgi:hypothetical protein
MCLCTLFIGEVTQHPRAYFRYKATLINFPEFDCTIEVTC